MHYWHLILLLWIHVTRNSRPRGELSELSGHVSTVTSNLCPCWPLCSCSLSVAHLLTSSQDAEMPHWLVSLQNTCGHIYFGEDVFRVIYSAVAYWERAEQALQTLLGSLKMWLWSDKGTHHRGGDESIISESILDAGTLRVGQTERGGCGGKAIYLV